MGTTLGFRHGDNPEPVPKMETEEGGKRGETEKQRGRERERGRERDLHH